MKNKILQSVIEITRQRDVDSIEYGLIATLAEILPVSEISLFKLLKENPLAIIEDGYPPFYLN